MRWQTIGLGLLLSLAAALTPARVAVAQSSVKPVYDQPIYDPGAKKYFALINDAPIAAKHNNNVTGMNWDQADIDARSRIYKGVRGRLAVVDSAEVHAFLFEKFHPDVEAWIGLRYWCERRRTQTTDGRFLDRNSFQVWVPKEHMDPLCKSSPLHYDRPKEEQYMGVAYQKPSDGPFQWKVKGWGKQYLAYFIEFPTGHP